MSLQLLLLPFVRQLLTLWYMTHWYQLVEILFLYLSLFPKKVKLIQLLCLNNCVILLKPWQGSTSLRRKVEPWVNPSMFYQDRQLDMKETSFTLCNESKGKKCTLHQVQSLHRVRLGMKSLTALVLVDFLAGEKALPWQVDATYLTVDFPSLLFSWLVFFPESSLYFHVDLCKYIAVVVVTQDIMW